MKNGYVNGEHDGKAIESGVASGKSNNKPISVTNHKKDQKGSSYANLLPGIGSFFTPIRDGLLLTLRHYGIRMDIFIRWAA